jgi:hypothetical protein
LIHLVRELHRKFDLKENEKDKRMIDALKSLITNLPGLNSSNVTAKTLGMPAFDFAIVCKSICLRESQYKIYDKLCAIPVYAPPGEGI